MHFNFSLIVSCARSVKSRFCAKSTFYTTSKNTIDLQLAPGKYQYRVFVYDFLGREAQVSAWNNFEILKASQPEIKSAVDEPLVADEEGVLELDVNISGITENSVVELVADSIVGSLVISGTKASSASEVENASKVRFRDVPPGKWRIRVTNPSGLSSESDATIEVQPPQAVLSDIAIDTKDDTDNSTEIAEPPVADKQPESTEESSVAEKQPVTDDEQPENVEKQPLSEPQEALEEVTEEKQTVAEPEAEKNKKKEKKEKPPKQPKPPKTPKPPKPPRPPYVCKDINILAGYDFAFTVFNSLSERTADAVKSPLFVAIPDIRVSYFPAKTEKSRFGGEVKFFEKKFAFEYKSDFYEMNIDAKFFQADIVYQRKIFSDKTFLSFKIGSGAVLAQKNAEYTVSISGRSEPESKAYVAPCALAGVSFFAIPMKFVVFEAGVDYTHTFFSLESQFALLTPYLAIGLRF